MFPRIHDKENKDSVQDVLLVLYLLSQAGNRISGKDPLLAKIKLLKLVFLSEKRMVEEKLKGFNFFFNVYTHGPSSKELLRMIDDLRYQKLMKFENNTFSITEKGEEMVSEFVETTPENKAFFNIVDEIIEGYGNLSPEEILDQVYAMEVKPMYSEETINIGEAVKNSPKKRLLMKLDAGDVAKELTVPDDWVETVNFTLNPEFA